MRLSIPVLTLGVLALGVASLSHGRDSYGLYAGANIANIRVIQDPAGTSSTTSATGPLVGFFYELPLGTNFAFTPGIGYVQKGTSEGFGTYPLTLNYVECPLTFKAYLSQSSFRPFLIAGPAFSILTGANSGSATGTIDVTSSVAQNELSFLAGAGIESDLTESTALSLGFQYSYGISNFAGSSLTGYDYRTTGIYIFAGLRFKMGDDYVDTEQRAKSYLDWRQNHRSNAVDHPSPETLPPTKVDADLPGVDTLDEKPASP